MTKRQYKNRIKKVRVSSKRVFYIRFRPVAQKLFFPIVLVIFSVACIDHWYSNRGTWVFENASAAVYEETNLIETEQPVSGGLGVNGTMDNTTASVAVPTGGTQVSSVSGSVIEAKTFFKSWKDGRDIAMEEIKQSSEEVGFSNVEGLYRLAHCESRFDKSRTNINYSKTFGKTTDRGIYQFNDKWQPQVSESCARDNKCATKEAIKKIEAGAINRWMCAHAYKNENYDYLKP